MCTEYLLCIPVATLLTIDSFFDCSLFSEGVKNSPQYASLYRGWALLEMRDGNHQAARKLITEALTRNKKNGHGWLVAAEIEEAGGNFGLVNLLLRRGIEVRKNIVLCGIVTLPFRAPN